jgi:hypothetical protein
MQKQINEGTAGVAPVSISQVAFPYHPSDKLQLSLLLLKSRTLSLKITHLTHVFIVLFAADQLCQKEGRHKQWAERLNFDRPALSHDRRTVRMRCC